MWGLMLWCVFRCRSALGWKDTWGVGKRCAACPQHGSQHDWKYVTRPCFYFLSFLAFTFSGKTVCRNISYITWEYNVDIQYVGFGSVLFHCFVFDLLVKVEKAIKGKTVINPDWSFPWPSICNKVVIDSFFFPNKTLPSYFPMCIVVSFFGGTCPSRVLRLWNTLKDTKTASSTLNG